MAYQYPKMPLNCQLSFGYSRFLDLHIYNICKTKTDCYKLVHSLAYKAHSTFAFTSKKSNIHAKYKHAIVPISLYRAHTRCTEQADINHHIGFMSSILKTRSQDPKVVKTKTLKFFKKKYRKIPISKTLQIHHRKTTSVVYDSVTKRHVFMTNLIRKSFKDSLMVVPKSKPNLGSILCPKRGIILKLSNRFNKSE